MRHNRLRPQDLFYSEPPFLRGACAPPQWCSNLLLGLHGRHRLEAEPCRSHDVAMPAQRCGRRAVPSERSSHFWPSDITDPTELEWSSPLRDSGGRHRNSQWLPSQPRHSTNRRAHPSAPRFEPGSEVLLVGGLAPRISCPAPTLSKLLDRSRAGYPRRGVLDAGGSRILG